MTIDPSTPFGFTLYALACFRLALLVSKEDGPYWMFRRLRQLVVREAKQHKTVQKSKMQQGIQCIFCVSIWMAVPLSIYATGILDLFWVKFIGDPLIFALALSAVAIIVNQHNTKGEL